MAEANPNSFVKVMLPMLADATLSDAEFRCLIALESWAWGKGHCHPGNAQLAERCGWIEDGKPSVQKAKRVLRRLQKLGRIRRRIVEVAGVKKREMIEILMPVIGDGSEMNRDGSEMNRDGSEMNRAQGQKCPDPQVEKDPTPGSKVSHSVDPSKDPGNQIHLTDPPTAAGGVMERPQGMRRRKGNPAEQALVLEALLALGEADGFRCYATHAQLSGVSGLAKSAVAAILVELEGEGLVARFHLEGQPKGRGHVIVLVDRPGGREWIAGLSPGRDLGPGAMDSLHRAGLRDRPWDPSMRIDRRA